MQIRLPWHAGLNGDDEDAVPTSSRPRRLWRRMVAVSVAALMLAVPVAVNASHLFSDVPTSHQFHTSISRLAGARITAGCGGTKYCPNVAVTRGEMAAFLVRGLGRMASTIDGAPDDWAAINPAPVAGTGNDDFGAVAPLTFRHGGATGGTGMVLATATIQVFTNEAGVCPCEVQSFLFNDTTGEISQIFFGMIGSEFAPADPDLADPVAYAETTVTMSYGFTVNSGVANDYGIAVRVVATTNPTVDDTDALESGWDATLQTFYSPFDQDGSNPPAPATQGGGGHRTPKSPRAD